MIITGRKSICCGADIRERSRYANVKTPKEWGDEVYVCMECRKPCEAYFTCLIKRETFDNMGALTDLVFGPKK